MPTDEPAPPADTELGDLALALIGSRFSVAPKRLLAPGPTPAQLQQLVEAAASAPDHHDLHPWRLVRIGDTQRERLAAVFEACSRERLPPPSETDVARARAKAFRAPTLLLAVMRRQPEDPEVPDAERAVTLGAALMAMLLAAHGMGYGAMLTSGRSVRTERFARALRLASDEQAVCFISIGTPTDVQSRPRPSAHELLTDWAPEGPPDAGAARG
ncbi:nitroreductase family protein [Ideonella sp. A 288]|uniref:nitroreductase family protein n=1 Tax=Ideonella sp. A 288 TaxID=1962181 RepID=UPI000B4B4370|nr:nitroreductase family protein [Ideonella sp. A 288]